MYLYTYKFKSISQPPCDTSAFSDMEFNNSLPKTAVLRSGFNDDAVFTKIVGVIWNDYSYQGCPFSFNEDNQCYITKDTLYVVLGMPRDRTILNNPEPYYSPDGRDYSWASVELPDGFKPMTCSLVNKGDDWTVHVYEADCKTYAIYDALSCKLLEQGIRSRPVNIELLY